jgi:hypothetical protein
MRLPWTRALSFIICGFFSSETPALGKNCEIDTANFVLVKQDDGITLYERWYAVNENQHAREVKATFTVNAETDAAVALIRNESLGKKWNKNTEEYRVLPSAGGIWFSYIQYDLPWPVSNQDCVLRYDQQYFDNSMEIVFRGTQHPAFPVQKRIQRIPEISGKWIFKESAQGIDVEYYITTTPSSTLPTWLTDPIIRNNLIETLQGFRKILEQKKI